MLFTESSLKKTVKYLLGNCYSKLVNNVFRQIIRIPFEIFPPGLVLKKEIYVIMRDHFWIYMSLLRIINFTSSYMIRDLMSLFYLTSNIPSKISHSTYGSEILRSARIISSKLVFQTTLKINYKNM